MAKITIEIPDHLSDWFLGIMSCSIEQVFMEAYTDCDVKEGQYLDFSYPGWKDKIVVTEGNDD